MARMPKFYSPYGPRPRRSAQLIAIWMAILVAALVATGMTNREVAAELFLSVKTVQYHLTRVYAKLGIRSRAELAARRAQDRTTDPATVEPG